MRFAPIMFNAGTSTNSVRNGKILSTKQSQMCGNHSSIVTVDRSQSGTKGYALFKLNIYRHSSDAELPIDFVKSGVYTDSPERTP